MSSQQSLPRIQNPYTTFLQSSLDQQNRSATLHLRIQTQRSSNNHFMPKNQTFQEIHSIMSISQFQTNKYSKQQHLCDVGQRLENAILKIILARQDKLLAFERVRKVAKDRNIKAQQIQSIKSYNRTLNQQKKKQIESHNKNQTKISKQKYVGRQNRALGTRFSPIKLKSPQKGHKRQLQTNPVQFSSIPCLHFITKIHNFNKEKLSQAFSRIRAQSYQNTLKHAKLVEFFYTLDNKIRQSTQIVINGNRQFVTAKQNLKKLCHNLKSNISSAFQIWRRNALISTIATADINRNKFNALECLERSVSVLQKSKVRKVIRCFLSNQQLYQNSLKGKIIQKIIQNKRDSLFCAIKLMRELSLHSLKEQTLKLKQSKALSFFQTIMKMKVSRLQITLQKFKFTNLQAKTLKEHTIYILNHNLQRNRRQCFRKWEKTTLQLKTVKSIYALSKFFSVLNKAVENNNRVLLPYKDFSKSQKCTLGKFCQRMIKSYEGRVKQAICILKKTEKSKVKRSKENNIWMGRSARRLILSSRIDLHKSFWRLRHFSQPDQQNSDNSMEIQNDPMATFKLQKMLNIINKLYKVNILNGFFAIQSKNVTKTNVSKFIGSQNSLTYSDDIEGIVNSGTTINLRFDQPRKISCSIMNRIFKRNVQKLLKRWHRIVTLGNSSVCLPQSQSSALWNQELSMKLASIKSFQNILSYKLISTQGFFFSRLILTASQTPFQQRIDLSIDDKLDSITRQNQLLKQIKVLKLQNQLLSTQLIEKDVKLKQCYENVAILKFDAVKAINERAGRIVQGVARMHNHRIMFVLFQKIICKSPPNLLNY